LLPPQQLSQVRSSSLFRAGTISDDQRALLDRDGNNNGRYDLGDFLAWVDRDQIRLSPAAMSRLMELVKSVGRLLFDSTTLTPRSRATTGALT